MGPGFSIGRSRGFAAPPRAMRHWHDHAVVVDAGWDREGRRTRDPRGRPQGTVDRILQLGQTSVYQGGRDIPGDEDWLLAQNIKLVVNCTSNLAMPAWVGAPSTPSWVRFPGTGAITRPDSSVGSLSSFWASLWREVDQAKEAGGSILIHCNAGAHRAGLVGSSIAMRELGLKPKDAVAHVRKRRVVTHVTGDLFATLASLAVDMSLRAPASAASSAAPAASPAAPARSAATGAMTATPGAALLLRPLQRLPRQLQPARQQPGR